MSNTDNPLEVDNQTSRGKLSGLSGDELYDRLHPKSGNQKQTAGDVLDGLRKQARDRTPGDPIGPAA